jgi:hypothetical protein
MNDFQTHVLVGSGGLLPLVWALAFVSRFNLDVPGEMALWIVIPAVCIFAWGLVYWFPGWSKEGS